MRCGGVCDVCCRGLSNNSLSGLLPDEYSRLTNLQEVYLDNNKLFGNLPSSWSQLANLKGM